MEKISLKTPEFFTIQGGAMAYAGACQEWFSTLWQRRAGCGPTTASNLCSYFAQKSPELRALCPWDTRAKEGMVRLMDAIWQHVTPGRMGVNTTAIFYRGFREYASRRGFLADPVYIDIPPLCRPRYADLENFMCEALAADRPIGFLNLSNGRVENLDSWHWVTLIELDTATHTATILDEGRRWPVDMKLWLETTKLGGGLCTFDVRSNT